MQQYCSTPDRATVARDKPDAIQSPPHLTLLVPVSFLLLLESVVAAEGKETAYERHRCRPSRRSTSVTGAVRTLRRPAEAVTVYEPGPCRHESALGRHPPACSRQSVSETVRRSPARDGPSARRDKSAATLRRGKRFTAAAGEQTPQTARLSPKQKPPHSPCH